MKLDPRLGLPGGPAADPIQKSDSKQLDASQTRSKAQGVSSGAGEDTVTLSSAAGDVQRLTSTLNGIPEVRNDRVQALKHKIQTGTYSIDHGKLADALLSESSRVNVKA
jgi:flagellar biosynthesis anti-sigma factor FlgM